MKAIARLTQLLLFTAGPKLKHDLLRGDTVNIYRYGNFPVYQSDWVYYRALMALASQAPGELCTATTAQIIRLANKPNNQSTRNTVQNLMSSLTGTYLVIKRNGQISVSSALVDHFSSSLSLRNKEIHFLINPVILNFWQSGQWDDKDDQCRISIGSSDLALWIYALFTAKECSVSPEFGILYDM